MSGRDKILDLALAYTAAREHVLDRKAERRALKCAHEVPGGDETDGYAPGVPPCRHQHTRPEGDPPPEREWCEPCRNGAALTREIPTLAARASGLERRLRAACVKYVNSGEEAARSSSSPQERQVTP